MKQKPSAKNLATTFTIPFTIVNLQKHFERTCDLWVIKTPTLKERAARSTIFVSALLCTIFWPINDIIINLTINTLAWIFLSLSSQPIPRFLLMLNLMLNLALLYTIIRLISGT